MSITLTKKQKDGLDLSLERYNNGSQGVVIAGFAGSGKSTLVRFIIEALPVAEEEVVYTSFTGKATLVLKEKGNANTMTLHKLLYKHIPKKDGTYVRVPQDTIDYKVVVIDEISMVPKEMIDLLFSHYGIFVICLGDPGQLPPVSKDSDNHLLDHPHIFLDEIMRQAQDSEIIKLTMDIRAGKKLKPMKGKEVQIVSKKELSEGMLLWADQIIVAKNATRDLINKKVRGLLGKNGGPEADDKIICQKNYWELMSSEGTPMLNGLSGNISNISFFKRKCPKWVENGKVIDYVKATFERDGELYSLNIDKEMLETGKKTISQASDFRLAKEAKKDPTKQKYKYPPQPLEFLYGYAISCWKAQGSEWDKVLVFEEDFPWDVEEHKRYLYTAATRAKEKLVIVLND